MQVRKAIISFILMVAVLIAGSAAAGWLIRTKSSAERSAITTPPPVVEVKKVVRRAVREVFTGYGTARSLREVTLTAEVTGEVIEMADGLADGSRVTAGQVLLRLDERSYRERVKRAESALADVAAQIARLGVEETNTARLSAIAEQEMLVNRDELKRLTDLFEMDLASKKEMGVARLAYQRSRREWQGLLNQSELIQPRLAILEALRGGREADLALAKLEVEKCEMVSPFSGYVDHLMVRVADRVQLGSLVVRLVNLDRIEVPIELPASVRSWLSVDGPSARGSAVRLSIDSAASRDVQPWLGRLTRLAPVADARSRTISAYVEVDNSDQAVPLIPGYFVTAEVEGPLWDDVLAIPRGAIVGDHVFVANADVAHERTVSIDRLVGELALVSGELSAGDHLILTNLDILHEGSAVRVQTGVTNRGTLTEKTK